MATTSSVAEPTVARNALVILAVIAAGATLYVLAPILTPLALAMFLAVMIDGFARVLEHRLPGVSRKAAMEMLLTGEPIDGEQAVKIGLINKVVAPEILEGETMLLANRIASKPRGTLKTGKEAFYRQLEMPLAEAYAYASKVMTENMLDAEACEGIGAFIEKRDPRWPA